MTKNNIPKGYKTSMVGVIPEKWEVIKLGDIGIFSKGNGVPKDKITSQGYPCLTYGDLYTKYDFIIKNITSFINEEISKTSKQINGGDICFAGSGETPQDIGKCATYLENHPAYAGGDIIILTPNNKIIDSLYVSYVINSHIGNKQRYKFAQGFSIVHIYTNNLKQIQIPLPPLNEQQKIVHILSLYDEAIEKQSKLIEKLELRKRGIMQRLLTGRTRLPGFTTPWKKMKLSEIGIISSAGVDKNIVEGEIPVRLLNFVDVFYRDFIYNQELNHWVTAKSIKVKQCSVQKGDVFFTPSSETQTDIAFSAVAMENMENVVYSYHIIRLRPLIDMDLHYRAYAFKTDEFYKQAQRICDGSGQRYVISQNGFRKMNIMLPSLSEQKAIANILTTIDKEINSQVKKLETLRTQKRGLMQQLLTGKTRVKI